MNRKILITIQAMLVHSCSIPYVCWYLLLYVVATTYVSVLTKDEQTSEMNNTGNEQTCEMNQIESEQICEVANLKDGIDMKIDK